MFFLNIGAAGRNGRIEMIGGGIGEGGESGRIRSVARGMYHRVAKRRQFDDV